MPSYMREYKAPPQEQFSVRRGINFVLRQQKNSEAGDDLLSREANRSTIGAGGLNFRVRHGTGWTPSAILTCFHCSIKTDKTVSAFSLSQLGLCGFASPTRPNSTNLKQVKASAR